jgi:hypothetical protein
MIILLFNFKIDENINTFEIFVDNAKIYKNFKFILILK